jgi:membrane protein YqaA with SNARE-associated domain
VALVCTVSSVLGGLGGYAIGMFAWESLGKLIVEGMLKIPLVSVDGRMDILMPNYLTSNFGDYLGGSYLFQVYDKWNAWIVGVFGLTPLPYKLVTITAGVAQVNISVFIIASIISRGVTFFCGLFNFKIGGRASKKIHR